MEIFELNGQARDASGKVGAKKIRREGQVPAVIYKSGGGDSISLTLNPGDFRNLIYTPKFRLVEINLDGTKYKCIVKDIQFHPVTDKVIHLDFLELVPGVTFKATVPLQWTGQAPGVREGGKFMPNMRSVNIMTTPEKVVDHMVADISNMKLGDTLRIRDITEIEGVEILNNPAVPIALVDIPRALRAGGLDDDEALEGAEGEGEGAEGEGEGGEGGEE